MVRYDYDYDDTALREWVGAAAGDAGAGEALFLFNNCHQGHAAGNARRMADLFARQDPAGHVVPPFAGGPPTQGSLFG
jgi:uncharacterized protein YecE (DUF72 family)